jgi:enamine deaminase RidA (YjgF/YER057c/UK114 family)
MGKKRKKKTTPARSKPKDSGRQFSNWLIVAAIFFFLSAGLVAKLVYAPVSGINGGSAMFQSASVDNASLEGQVRLVAANFKCACGQCGELFLIDCTCDMARGAVEEKNFIRNKLRQGMTVDQVINLTDQEYGHKII